MPTENEQKWIDAWRFAGPELARIRREELRNLSDEEGMRLLGASGDSNEFRNGLVTFQAWMSRWRILQLMERAETE